MMRPTGPRRESQELSPPTMVLSGRFGSKSDFDARNAPTTREHGRVLTQQSSKSSTQGGPPGGGGSTSHTGLTPCILCPPVTVSVVPVMKPASAAVRNTTLLRDLLLLARGDCRSAPEAFIHTSFHRRNHPVLIEPANYIQRNAALAFSSAKALVKPMSPASPSESINRAALALFAV